MQTDLRGMCGSCLALEVDTALQACNNIISKWKQFAALAMKDLERKRAICL